MSHITFKAPATIKHYITLRWKLTYDVRLAVALNGTPANSTGDGGPPSWDCVADATAGAHTVVGSYHHGAGQVGGTLQRVSNGSLNLTDVTQNYTDRFEMNMTKGEVIELWEYVEVSVGCESYYGATGDRFSAFLDVSGRNGTGAAFLGITD